MKLIISLFSILVAIHTNAQTTPQKWEVSLAVGTQTYPLNLQRPLLYFYVLGAPEFTDRSFSGTISYQTNNARLQFGVSATHITVRQQRGESWNWSGSSDPTYHTISTNNIVAVMPFATYSYLLKRKVRLYSKLNVGVAFSKFESVVAKTINNTTQFAFQFTPVGCRLGDNLAFFVELGYGYQGLFQAGVAVKLPHKRSR